MSGPLTGRAGAGEATCNLFLLIASAELAQDRPRRAPVEVFTSEAGGRKAFERLRLQVGSGSGWAQLIAVHDDVARPLCWFGRPAEPLVARTRRARRARRRRAVGAPDRAGAPGAARLTGPGLVTAVQDSDTRGASIFFSCRAERGR